MKIEQEYHNCDIKRIRSFGEGFMVGASVVAVVVGLAYGIAVIFA